MSRPIICEMCGIQLGEIRDARLRKGISHFCAICTNFVKLMIEADKRNSKVWHQASHHKNTSTKFYDDFSRIFKE